MEQNMAASYAIPLNGSMLNGQGIHGHSHTRSQHRKQAPDRMPLASSLTNSGPGGPLNAERSHMHAHSKSLPLNSWPASRHAKHQPVRSHQPIHELEPSNFDTEPFPTIPHEAHKVGKHLRVQPTSYESPDLAVPVMEHHHPGREGMSKAWLTLPEAITACLIPLPYALAALVLTSQFRKAPVDLVTASLNQSEIVGEPLEEEKPVDLATHIPFEAVCALTAATLLVIGVVGKWRSINRTLDRRKPDLGHDHGSHGIATIITVDTMRRLLFRILSVGLPFYASGLLGGERVAMIILVTMAASLGRINAATADFASLEGWKDNIGRHRWTVAVVILQLVSDASGITSAAGLRSILLGYIALGLSATVLPPPFSTTEPKASMVTSPMPNSELKTSAVLTPWEAPPNAIMLTMPKSLSPLISTAKDTNLTLISGSLTITISLIVFVISNNQYHLSKLFLPALLTIGAAVLSFLFADPKAFHSDKKIGLSLGLIFTVLLQEFLHVDALFFIFFQGVLILASWAASVFDARHLAKPKQYRRRRNTFIKRESHSKITGSLLSATEDWTLLHNILLEKDSRRIFYFMCLNFGFMLVQTFYATVTGSLGLLSDSIHMLFDCLALVVGLCAAIMSRWPPSLKFPYGFGKMDTLAGFANGVFLMLISVEIIYEAVERLAEGSQMQRIGELLTVSSLGLVVNLVGMMAFGHAHHGHGHSHGGHDHSHGHSHGEHGHSHEHAHAEHVHSCEDHSHSHDERDNPHGVRDHPHSHTHPHNPVGHDHSHDVPDHSHDAPDHSHNDHTHPHVGHSNSPEKISHLKNRHHDSHSHSHSSHSYDAGPRSPLPFTVPPTPSKPLPPPSPPSHSHGRGHGHDDHHENMHGIFLHVLADTLGSAAVVVSTILIHFTGWSGFDPLASCLIAILIFASAVPLVSSSAKQLLFTVPEAAEFDVREVLAGVSALRGVTNVCVPRFWMGEGEGAKVCGVMHVIAGRGVELEELRGRTVRFLEARGMDVLVQVEREGEGRCWCGGGLRNP